MSISRRATSAELSTFTSYSSIKIRRKAWARAQFSGCSSTTTVDSETGQMEVCCQILPLGELSSRSASSVLVGELLKKLSLFLNTGVNMDIYNYFINQL